DDTSCTEKCKGAEAGAQLDHAQIGPLPRPTSREALVRGVVAAVLCAGLGLRPACASTVVVPDDSSTVQSAIDSGADTVLVREGTYLESALVERGLVLLGIGISSRPRLSGLTITNRLEPLSTIVSGFDISSTVAYTEVVGKSPSTISLSDC